MKLVVFFSIVLDLVMPSMSLTVPRICSGFILRSSIEYRFPDNFGRNGHSVDATDYMEDSATPIDHRTMVWH